MKKRLDNERILGGSDFVKSVFAQAKEDVDRKDQLQSEGISIEHVVNRVAGLLDMAPEQVLSGSKHKETVVARSLLCFWASTELAISQVDLAQKLKISQPAVSMAVRRGKQLTKRDNFTLRMSRNL